MARGQTAQTWRMLRLIGWSVHRCKYCGRPHEYRARPSQGSICQPVIFPPGFAASGRMVSIFAIPPVPALSLAPVAHECQYQAPNPPDPVIDTIREWPDLFGNPLLASAGLDRLAHHGETLIITGRSYRARGRAKDEAGRGLLKEEGGAPTREQ